MRSDTEMLSNMIGLRYGRLLVQKVVPHGQRALRLMCHCDCGATTTSTRYSLVSGEKKSCGCLKRSVLGDATRTHGRANSRVTGYANRTYGIWQAMHDRCTNKNRADYRYYGGRGISVCARWDSFENFLADMGEAPVSLTLDRLDNMLGYSPDNCRWASRKEQVYNTRHMVWLTIGDKTQHIGGWLKELCVPPDTYYKRLRRGLTKEQALGLPTSD